VSLSDTLRRFLNIREPTKEDLKMASKEMDYFLRQLGGSPLVGSRRRRFTIKRKHKDEPGKVRTVATVRVIDGKKD